ncbi:DUF4198 domain-containing protein [Sporohalobacter salinus]|uniref:DUF4198 domain-containing protein n=1 Tax=Sporohalobacter salinus TaxID=1494606 RepID=UPI0019614C70|nr:DUF4198 domain-containing protein [Sporohalobacter salinus]MBM7622615.1 putative GH25 family protein [Sporohalobacter salinus]
MKKYSLVTLILILSLTMISGLASAHYLWLETIDNYHNSNKTIFKAYWGHFKNDITNLNTTKLKAYLQRSDGIRKELNLTDKKTYLSGKTKLHPGGNHQIYVIRPVSIYKKSLYQFTAKSIIHTTSKEKVSTKNKAVGLPLEIIPQTKIHELNAGDDFTIEVRYKGRVMPNTKISVITKSNPTEPVQLKTNQSGKATFTLEKNDDYLIVAKHTVNTHGKWHGKDYNQISHINTLYLSNIN